MHGRPERAPTNVLVLRAQPRSTHSHALPLTVTIAVTAAFVASSSHARTTPATL